MTTSTGVGTSPCGTVRSSSSPDRGGLSGRTSPTSCEFTGDGLLVASSGGLRNSGIVACGLCLTLEVSECPKVAAACSLSDMLTRGLPPGQSLTDRQVLRMVGRLEKYGKRGGPLWEALTRYLAGPVTKPPSTE